ncbi:hypothetical protein [Sphingobium sp. DC-2]|uniref:hypothetical protein n=1 Tax=Sphingobium sp. DC-2 TaxID=1303256 RepID=UPI0004C47859|nr:hypothetical protein [Sphingobium sp. DC-2]
MPEQPKTPVQINLAKGTSWSMPAGTLVKLASGEYFRECRVEYADDLVVDFQAFQQIPAEDSITMHGARMVVQKELLHAVVLIAEAQSNAKLRYRPSLLLDMLVPAERAQDMQANLAELFPLWVERHGQLKANMICRFQVILMIGGTWWEKVLTTCERLLKVFRLSGG